MSTWKYCLVGDDNETLLKGWQKVGDYYYYLYSNGAMAESEWFQDTNGYWYYLDGNGRMLTGLQTINNIMYYFHETSDGSQAQYFGAMAKNCSIAVNDTTYTADNNGCLSVGIGGLSSEGADFICSWEGYSSTWEDVGDGYQTIGIGTSTSGTLGLQLYNSGVTSCTKEQAKEWLQQECVTCYEAIKEKLDDSGVTLKQNQIDALISMAYNIGQYGLIGSTLFKNILSGITDPDILLGNFEAWDKCNGHVLQGLKNRRDSEYALFVNADYTGNN
ncbi:MAG: lysozyme [Haloplasmataceae bacterium]|jgi:lysozyme|nr:lysozyme [Haloplasmataceae bacterium]